MYQNRFIATQEYVLPIMKECAWRCKFLQDCREYHEKMLRAQQILRRQINRKQARYTYLKNVWKDELALYHRENLLSEKKEAKKLVKAYESDKYDPEIADLIIRLWLKKTKFMHTLAFFQWRG